MKIYLVISTYGAYDQCWEEVSGVYGSRVHAEEHAAQIGHDHTRVDEHEVWAAFQPGGRS